MDTTTKCGRRNGTYCCQLDAGHDGPHSKREREYNGRNELVSIVVYSWADSYSSMRSRRYSAA